MGKLVEAANSESAGDAVITPAWTVVAHYDDHDHVYGIRCATEAEAQASADEKQAAIDERTMNSPHGVRRYSVLSYMHDRELWPVIRYHRDGE